MRYMLDSFRRYSLTSCGVYPTVWSWSWRFHVQSKAPTIEKASTKVIPILVFANVNCYAWHRKFREAGQTLKNTPLLRWTIVCPQSWIPIVYSVGGDSYCQQKKWTVRFHRHSSCTCTWECNLLHTVPFELTKSIHFCTFFLVASFHRGCFVEANFPFVTR